MMNKLYPYQEQILQETQDKTRVAYYLDMGLGKTFVGSAKLMDLGSKTNLLICQKSKINDWLEHTTTHCNLQCFDLTKPKELKQFLASDNSLGIINYELAWRRKELLNLKDFTLMLDESSLIQNDRAKQTKFILKLKAQNVILLSGTATSGKYENLWSQAHLLGWDINKTTYNDQYVNWDTINVGGVMIKVVRKHNPYKNVDRLKAKLREHGAIFMKTEEVIDLPAQTFTEVKVNAPAYYKRFMKENYMVFENQDLIATTPLTKRLYARQIASQFNEYKIQAVKDLISSTNDRLVIFYNFNYEYELLEGICKAQNRPISIVNGTLKDLSMYKEDNSSITLIQYQAGAMGLNLQLANKTIYFSLPERSELFEQSKKRIHRLGQKRPCYYYILMAQKTIDESILKALKLKQDYTDELFKKEW